MTEEQKKNWHAYIREYNKRTYITKSFIIGRKDDGKCIELQKRLKEFEKNGGSPSKLVRDFLLEHFGL